MALMAASVMIGNGSLGFSWIQFKSRKRNVWIHRSKVFCSSSSSSSSSSSVMDPYKTLRIRPDASESEVKKAFRQLALQYHPDVCRGENCEIRFQTINEAYNMVMRELRGEAEEPKTCYEPYDDGVEEGFWEIDDPDSGMWEEWMGWEGAGIRDYSSHINLYV